MSAAQKIKPISNRIIVIFLIIFSQWLLSCESAENLTSTPLLEKIKQRKKLIVLTTNLPTTYYYNRDNQLTGPEYLMAESFAKFIGIKVEYKPYDSVESVLKALKNHEGDIAAAGLTKTQKRSEDFDFGPVYQKVNEYVICHRSKRYLKKPEDLKNINIVVSAGTSFINTLKNYPNANWVISKETNTEGLLRQVASKKIDCTVSDSTLYNIDRRYHTNLQEKFILSKGAELAWFINKDESLLLSEINNWFKQYKENKELEHMLDKFYGYVEIFDYVDTRKFLNRIKTRLPKYKDFFIDAAKKNGIKPTLLAAQSYQESHWDRKAKSPTGVRGIMMLTQPVAKAMGVTNRLHAKQNIYAGAKFQAKMKKMVSDVKEPDQSWLALAAYNVGRGHFRDAQSLAKKLNKNPDRWSDMKEVLPLLSKKEYYKDLRYGYTRGNEPVQYVTRIRNYNELLQLHFKK